MTFNLNYFLAAVALLWLPLPYLARRDQAFNNRARVSSATMGGAFGAWQNWADLVRSAVGAYALMELSIGLEPGSTDVNLAQWIKLGIILAGVLFQVVRFGQGILAPIFYLTGLTAVLPHSLESGFAVLLAWIFGGGARDPRFVLPIMGSALLVASYFVGEMNVVVMFNVGLIFLPLGLALLLQKRQMFVTREPRVSTYQRRRYKILRPASLPTPKAKEPLKTGELKSRPSAAGE